MKTGPKPSPPRNTAPTTQQSRHRPKPMTKPSPPGSDAWRRRRRRRRRGGENWECEWARGGLTSRWSSWGRQAWFGERKRSETFSWGCLDGGKTGDQKIMGKLGREGLSLGDSRERKRVWGESSSGVLMGTRGMVTTQSECGDGGVLNSRVDSRGSGEWLSRLTRLPPNFSCTGWSWTAINWRSCLLVSKLQFCPWYYSILYCVRRCTQSYIPLWSIYTMNWKIGFYRYISLICRISDSPKRILSTNYRMEGISKKLSKYQQNWWKHRVSEYWKYMGYFGYMDELSDISENISDISGNISNEISKIFLKTFLKNYMYLSFFIF